MNREDAKTVKTPMPRGYRPTTDEDHTKTVRIDPDAMLFALESQDFGTMDVADEPVVEAPGTPAIPWRGVLVAVFAGVGLFSLWWL